MRRGPFVALCDLGETVGLSPAQRVTLARSMSQNDEVARRCVGQALVIDAPVARHMFTALLSMTESLYPVRVFGHPGEARAWLKESLRAALVTLAARVVAG